MDSALKKSYCYELLSLTAGSSTSNYYLKEKSSYLPAILVGCWLSYCCSVSHFSIYRLGYFSFSFMLSQFITPILSTGVDSHVCAQRVYVCYFMGWSLDLYRSGDQTEKWTWTAVRYLQGNKKMTDFSAERRILLSYVLIWLLLLRIRCSHGK